MALWLGTSNVLLTEQKDGITAVFFIFVRDFCPT